jgi:peptide/nickel transport system permease protein
MTMTVGAVAVIISTVIGIIIGGISGFFGGKVDIVLQRICEVFSAMPFLPFAMILSTIIGNQVNESMRIFIIMVILGILEWPSLARLVRAQVLAEREKEFVTAAKAMGVKKLHIVFKHIIPNVISVIIVTATLDFATCMLTEASLSFLGFGVQLPRPTWGNMLYGCVDSVVIQNYWWRWVFPAVLLSICVICINTVGDGLRDAIDPKSNEK